MTDGDGRLSQTIRGLCGVMGHWNPRSIRCGTHDQKAGQTHQYQDEPHEEDVYKRQSLYRTTNYRTLSEAIQAPSSKGLFGVGENEDIEVGKLYGNYADQSARIIYTPNTMHMLEPDSAECMRLFLHELEASTTAPKSMSNASFTYWIKDIAMFVVFADLSLILFALVQLLLGTEFFSSLVLERENRYIGFEPKSGPWVAAVAFLTFACCCLYIFGYQYYSKLPIVGKLGNAGGKCVWSVLTGMVLAVYLIIFHIIRGKKNGAVAGDYGLATTSASGFSPMYLLKCLAFGGTVFAIDVYKRQLLPPRAHRQALPAPRRRGVRALGQGAV